jgi:Glycosyl hydrolase family 65, N-terminal domain
MKLGIPLLALSMLGPVFAVRSGAAQPATEALANTAPPLRLWYQQAAKKWEEALPLGNGRLGAMVFGTLSFKVGLTRQRNATVTAEGNQLHLDGQIVDVEKKDGGFDDNAGGSGPGGAHMKFAGRLLAKVDRGKVIPGGNSPSPPMKP